MDCLKNKIPASYPQSEENPSFIIGLGGVKKRPFDFYYKITYTRLSVEVLKNAFVSSGHLIIMED